jgi:D-sedoheptulose 7-phosphate isomerase
MFNTILEKHLDCFAQLKSLAAEIEQTGALLADTIQSGGKILVCGNGGSAADAQHFAAELIGRFEQERNAWPAIALTTDTSVLTAIGNDYGFADIFARQVQGLGRQGDALIGISTSGNSENVMRAVTTARQQQMKTIGLAGGNGGHLKALVDRSIVINQSTTARVQEAHLFILHYWALLIEQHMQTRSGNGQSDHSIS